MFGYVRPCRPELKCKEFDLYRATYCGLCRCLRQRYGLIAPLFLSYDLTFLALLLWEPETAFKPCSGRCYANPFRKKVMCPNTPALERAADLSVILSWWKLQDSVRDGSFSERLTAGGLALLLRPAYKKAAELQPVFDEQTRANLSRLSDMEREKCSSIDRTADAFACLLRAAAQSDNGQERVLGQLLYHVGRWIYLIDARDDFEQDKLSGAYNPLLLRYGTSGDDASLCLTLDHSLEMAGTALQLGEFGCRKPILENILYLGLPLVQKAVLDGSWAQIKKQKIWRHDT